jgi:hypothetical protein
MEYHCEEDIFRFDISVDNKFLVDIVKADADLANDGTGCRLFHSIIFPKKLKQLTISAILY